MQIFSKKSAKKIDLSIYISAYDGQQELARKLPSRSTDVRQSLFCTFNILHTISGELRKARWRPKYFSKKVHKIGILGEM